MGPTGIDPSDTGRPWFEVAAVVAATIAGPLILAALTGVAAITPLGTLLGVAVAGWLLGQRGSGWRDHGLGRPGNLGQAILGGIGLAGLMTGTLLILEPLFESRFGAPDLSAFSNVEGNLGMLLWFLVIAWLPAAFGEEAVFRGFVLESLGAGLGAGRLAEFTALALQAVIFGLAHSYQGISGVLITGLLGLLLGFGYLALGKNLWPCVFAHGVVNSIGMTELYLGRSLF